MGGRNLTHSHPLLDAIKEELDLLSDAQLAERMGAAKSTISKLRSRKIAISAETILMVYDITDWSIELIRDLIAKSNTQEETA